jgi:hypothetical protein
MLLLCVHLFHGIYIHVKGVPSHCDMACPQVVDGGDGLQIWRVAVNILNKQSWTADGVDLQIGGWVGRLTTCHHKTSNCV